LNISFDLESEQKIMNYLTNIKELGISSYLLDMGKFPYITIGGFRDIDITHASETLKKYCTELEKFKIRFSSIGIFTHPTTGVFLAPVANKKLLDLHEGLHKKFSVYSVEGFEYYLPDVWVPHCAIDVSADVNVVCKSTEYLMRNFKPFDVEITNIGWVEASKTTIKRLEYFELR